MFDDFDIDDYDHKVVLGSIVGGVGMMLLTFGCILRRYCRKRRYRSSYRLKGYRGGTKIGKTRAYYAEDKNRSIPINMSFSNHKETNEKSYLQSSPFMNQGPYPYPPYPNREFMYPPAPQMELVYPQMGYIMTNHNGHHHLMSPPSYRVIPNLDGIREENIKLTKEEKKEEKKEERKKDTEMSTQTDEEK